MIRLLQYLCNTRPNLAFSVDIMSRFIGRPKASHFVRVKRILRYVKGLIGYINLFSVADKGWNCKLIGYTDLNQCGDKDDIKSIVGYIFMYVETSISWCSKKEPVVVFSSCEAECITTSMCVCVSNCMVDEFNEGIMQRREWGCDFNDRQHFC